MAERFKPMELRSQAFGCRFVINMFLPSSPGPTELTADRYCGSTCASRAGEANEQGSEGVGLREPGHYCQGAKGPGPAIALKRLAITRTSTVEKSKPVDIKFFLDDFFPSLSILKKRG